MYDYIFIECLSLRATICSLNSGFEGKFKNNCTVEIFFKSGIDLAIAILVKLFL